MSNKKLKTLTLPGEDGSSITYDLYPNWDNIENKPDFSELSGGVGQEYEVNGVLKGEIFNDYENNIASGEASHAEGNMTIAGGHFSHAEGNATIATSESQHVQGKYNILDEDANGNPLNTYAHIVGNGDAFSGRSNAHTLDWSGNAWYAGSITATQMILGTEGYGTELPATGVEGQIFFLIGENGGGTITATDDGTGIITIS